MTTPNLILTNHESIVYHDGGRGHVPTVIVISPCWPGDSSGYSIAVKSALEQYCNFFDQVIFIGLVNQSGTFVDKKIGGTAIQWHEVMIEEYPKWVRFGQSLFSPFPATAMKFLSQAVQRQIHALIQYYYATAPQMSIIIEDIPPAALGIALKRHYPTIPMAIHSHNIAGKIFEGLYDEASMVRRYLWSIEVSKLCKLEENIIRQADYLWAISKSDQTEYYKRYNLQPNGIVGVSIATERYTNVGEGDLQTLLYLGTADLRKGYGLATFISQAWAAIKRAVPAAQFKLAGRHTEQFSKPTQGIYGMGFCADEISFLNQGAIFVNPQEVGSGIKLKSIIAMAAGKALVTTKTGIEGIPGKHQEHFLVADHTRDLVPLLIELMQEPELIQQLAYNARKLVAEEYTQAKQKEAVWPLLQQLCRHEPNKLLTYHKVTQ